MNIEEFYQQINPNYDKQLLLDICDIDDLDAQYDDALEIIKEFPVETKKSFEIVSNTTPTSLDKLNTFKSAIHALKNSANDYQFQKLFEVSKELDVLCRQLLENKIITMPREFYQYQKEVVFLYSQVAALIEDIH